MKYKKNENIKKVINTIDKIGKYYLIYKGKKYIRVYGIKDLNIIKLKKLFSRVKK